VALASATANVADAFRLSDRGRIVPGQRAELLLVRGDPTIDITAKRDVLRVCRSGVEFNRSVQQPRSTRHPTWLGIIACSFWAAMKSDSPSRRDCHIATRRSTIRRDVFSRCRGLCVSAYAYTAVFLSIPAVSVRTLFTVFTMLKVQVRLAPDTAGLHKTATGVIRPVQVGRYKLTGRSPVRSSARVKRDRALVGPRRVRTSETP
jgi:hypothetical protein